MPSPSSVNQKILGLDHGLRRVGVAISDPSQSVAFPRETWRVRSDQECLEKLKSIVTKESISTIVIGWPVAMNGKETQQTKAVDQFITLAQSAFPEITIEKMDERLTSHQAERWGGDDAVAAQIILQTYLDRLA